MKHVREPLPDVQLAPPGGLRRAGRASSTAPRRRTWPTATPTRTSSIADLEDVLAIETAAQRATRPARRPRCCGRSRASAPAPPAPAAAPRPPRRRWPSWLLVPSRSSSSAVLLLGATGPSAGPGSPAWASRRPRPRPSSLASQRRPRLRPLGDRRRAPRRRRPRGRQRPRHRVDDGELPGRRLGQAGRRGLRRRPARHEGAASMRVDTTSSPGFAAAVYVADDGAAQAARGLDQGRLGAERRAPAGHPAVAVDGKHRYWLAVDHQAPAGCQTRRRSPRSTCTADRWGRASRLGRVGPPRGVTLAGQGQQALEHAPRSPGRRPPAELARRRSSA